ncbi:MAG TPA: YdcF family protein [Bryobacteraceae bacterium]|nr:YdcF family protein [Bryobacteraceae bacterium]
MSSLPATRITEDVLASARLVWDYLLLGHKTIPGDIIIALGTNDLRVAEFAAKLYQQGHGKILVCTGAIAHQGDLLATPWDRTEAEMYAGVAEQNGVPRDRILLETKATNTAENIRLSRRLIAEHELRPDNVVLCCKPFMQRRTWATMVVEWPEMPASLASPVMTLEEYFTDVLTPEKIINIMLGDLQRVWIYGRRGWSAPQLLPENVKAAYTRLKSLGFDRHLLQEDE